jgi:enterochelin esterase family protein
MAATGTAQQPARIVSPEVAADRRVTFRLLAPQAREILLTGEFMPGSKPFDKDTNGLWTLTLGPLEPEIYHYNVTIDGVRTIDPNNPDVKTGSTPSTISSILEVRGNQPAFYDAQTAEHGDVRSLRYKSQSLGTERRLTVYLPPEYERDSQARYPVLYLLHGANADETAWHRLGRVNLILDNLRASGRAKPFIVVMPFGYGVPPNLPAQPGENTAKFGRDLIDDVIPLIESRFRAIADRDHRALVGLSMGGGEALTIGLNHLELFRRRLRSCLPEDLREPHRRRQDVEPEAPIALGRLRQGGWHLRRVQEFLGVSDAASHPSYVPRKFGRAHLDGVAPLPE